ncbi:MAG: UDP-N-acetylmuramate dehydrogenase [Chitinophagaceae bacterium]|nr:MAG: UDP-N-acetylmuramate dehydrogenase [Chitinophagaceae bacterium]
MQVHENYPLRDLNTFGITETARYFSVFKDEAELEELLARHKKLSEVSKFPPMILGGGSNILLTGKINRIVLKNEIGGMNIIKEDTNHVYIKVGAGENWHRFVLFCLENNLGGAENLSLIPGNVGASPMQNIGAYGAELREIFDELEAFDLQSGKAFMFSVNDCEFGYRDSIFKRKFKDRFVILNVTFRLNKKHDYRISYGAISKELERMRVKDLSIQAISQAVINIRTSKLPDPKVIGNAGSFFKNPTVTESTYEKLGSKFPEIVAYPLEDGSMKLAAGWLIEQCGWKGYRKGDAGCHAQQALVLVNYGNAKGSEIHALGVEIAHSVKKKFGVQLEREVNII